MVKKIITFLILVGLTVSVWLVNIQYEDVDFAKIFYSFVAVSVSYLLFKVLLEGVATKRIQDSKARYSFRKTTQILFLVVSGIIVLRIWVVNPQALLVAYGLVGAGIAVALQDVFKNFAGALALLLTGIYRVGDRIAINEKYGDVIDIGVFYTTLLEMRGWVQGDQTTGRLTTIPNGLVLSYPVHNYTKDHAFIWDEFMLPITYTSDWQKASELIRIIVEEETKVFTEQAEREISHLSEQYYISKRNTEPNVFITPTDNWIAFNVRYVVEVRERRVIQNKLMRRILEELPKHESIQIASSTLTITNSKGL